MKHFTNRRALALVSLTLLGILLLSGCSKPEPPPAGYYTGPLEGKGKNGATAPGKAKGVITD
jgi:hypothetical protein